MRRFTVPGRAFAPYLPVAGCRSAFVRFSF